MSTYRTHLCDELRPTHVGETVKLSGWVFRRRDHGGVVFVDLRDNYGITQVVFDPDNAGAELIDQITHLSLESVIEVEGKVVARADDLVNPKLPTGEIEVDAQKLTIHSRVEQMPYNISDDSIPEEMRLKYRFLDLRTDKMHKTMHLRSDFISSLRRRMNELSFREFQTPILTASSPEGARDFLVPSRLHPGKFYALPQAPQQFKQLLMVSGFDKYFQIAPCFRDEDPRADRSPLDFYQLDMEMSFAGQDDVFEVVENVIGGAFDEFKNWGDFNRTVNTTPWPRITYADTMLKYGTDKPDLRNPIEIADVSDVFEKTDFAVFKNIIASGGYVRAIPAPKAAEKPRSWFDAIGNWAQKELKAPAAPGYISFKEGEFKGPLLKFLGEDLTKEVFDRCGCAEGDVVFFVAAKAPFIYKLAAPLRDRLGQDLELIDENHFEFAWIVDYPMFEKDDETGKIDFSHNPFSMPQGGLEALNSEDPLNIKAWQYDLVCNGYELCSGAVRNHSPEIMYKAFEMAGYPNSEVDARFGAMIKAFKHGAPPHAGAAPGIERMIMLLSNTDNIREVMLFPANGQAQDLLMEAPAEVSEAQLKELHLMHVNIPKKEDAA
jgi:aspartyl-tRNA synthetase